MNCRDDLDVKTNVSKPKNSFVSSRILETIEKGLFVKLVLATISDFIHVLKVIPIISIVIVVVT